MIYFLQHRDDAYVKIGMTGNIYKRLEQLEEEYGNSFVVLGVMNGGRAEEQQLHAQFSHLKRFGEWYRPGADLLDFINTHASPLPPLDSEAKRSDELAQLYTRLQYVRLLYYERHPSGMTDGELAQILGTTRMTACRYRRLLNGVKVARGKYTVLPSEWDIRIAITTLQTAIFSNQISSMHVTSALQGHNG